MLIPNCPDKALRRDLDALGRAYLDALASQDWRASDRHLVRLRTKLGTILALLGWHPDDGRPDVVVTGGRASEPRWCRARFHPNEAHAGMCLRRRARRWARVRARARIMHGRHGSEAYYLARERARRPDGRRVWFWTRVAVELARLEGREIGLSTSDRWR